MKKILEKTLISILEYRTYRRYCIRFFKGKIKKILTRKQKLEIDNFYKKYYGKKISYKWHNLFTLFNGTFDVKYVPFDICFSSFTDMILNKNKNNILKDKNFLYNIAKYADVKIPKRFFYSINGIFFDSDNNIISKQDFYKQISNIGEVFIKPTQVENTGNANKCRIVKIINGTDISSKISIKDIIEKDYNMDFVIQEKIVCHKSISDIHPQSVNTFGINTVILNNEVKILNSVLQIGTGKNTIDWCGFDKKSLFILVNKDGVLYDSAICPNDRQKYFSHPDTGIIFKNYKIEHYKKVLETVKKLHLAIPWIQFCNWGITIDCNGNPIVIEMENPSCMTDQLLLSTGLFGEYTEEFLSLSKNKKF